MRLAFYNVENLFDTINDSLVNDDEFCKNGIRNWSISRYNAKIHKIAKVIIAIGQWKPPSVIGLSEIENPQVITDLIQTRELRKLQYSYIHYPSPDKRGIDVALIYLKKEFNPIFSKTIRVLDSSDASFRTRDMLYTKGLLQNNDTLHLFVCHWPSRYGGQALSERKRVLASKVLSHNLDSLYLMEPKAQIVIMGDFNDEYYNPSLQSLIQRQSSKLTNLMASMDPASGSHRYKGRWAYLDQIIVSNNLLGAGTLSIDNGSASVMDRKFLLEKDPKHPGLRPFRTYIGYKYHNGFSDHLPVYIDLVFNKVVD